MSPLRTSRRWKLIEPVSKAEPNGSNRRGSQDTHIRTPAVGSEVPYVVAVESYVDGHGAWLRRAWHPELPGCMAEAESALDALDQLSALAEGSRRSRSHDEEFDPPARAPLRWLPVERPAHR